MEFVHMWVHDGFGYSTVRISRSAKKDTREEDKNVAAILINSFD